MTSSPDNPDRETDLADVVGLSSLSFAVMCSEVGHGPAPAVLVALADIGFHLSITLGVSLLLYAALFRRIASDAWGIALVGSGLLLCGTVPAYSMSIACNIVVCGLGLLVAAACCRVAYRLAVLALHNRR